MPVLEAQQDPEQAGFDAMRLQRIADHFQGYVDDGRLPGWSMAVARAGRIVYGNYDSVSAGSEVFFSGSFGSERTWYVGLDNFDNRHSKRMRAVKVSAACAPSENPRSKRAERAARQRVKAAVRRHMAAVGYDEEYGDFDAASKPKPD